MRIKSNDLPRYSKREFLAQDPPRANFANNSRQSTVKPIARTWSFSLPINGLPSGHSYSARSSISPLERWETFLRDETRERGVKRRATKWGRVSSQFNQQAQLARRGGRGGGGTGWCVTSPECKAGIHLLQFCIDARDKGERRREREIEREREI